MSDDMITTRIDEWRSNIFPANGERDDGYPFPDSKLQAPELAFDGVDDVDDDDVLEAKGTQFIVCFIDAEVLDTYTDGNGNTINVYESAPKHGVAEIVYTAVATSEIRTISGKSIAEGSTIVYVRRPTEATSENICVLDTQVIGNDYGLGCASGLVEFFYYTDAEFGAGSRFGAEVGQWYAVPDMEGPLRYSFDIETGIASGHFNYMERQFEYPVPDVDAILVYNDSGEEAPVGGFAQQNDYGTTDEGYRYYEIIKPDEDNSKAACILLGTPNGSGEYEAIPDGGWGLAKTSGTAEALCTSGCGAEDRVGTVSGSWIGDAVDDGPFLKTMDTENSLSSGFIGYGGGSSSTMNTDRPRMWIAGTSAAGWWGGGAIINTLPSETVTIKLHWYDTNGCEAVYEADIPPKQHLYTNTIDPSDWTDISGYDQSLNTIIEIEVISSGHSNEDVELFAMGGNGTEGFNSMFRKGGLL